MKRTLLSAALLALATSGVAAAAELQAKIEVSGLFCPSCSYIAGNAIESVDSVQITEFSENGQNQTAVYVVSYDDAKATPAQITEAVAGYGYSATILDDPSS